MDGKKLKIMLFSDVRLQTKLGGNEQGDHVTAYRTFFELISSCINNQEPEESLESLRMVTNSYLEPKVCKELDALKEKCMNKLKKFTIDRKTRKNDTKEMRRRGDSEDKIMKYKYSLNSARTAIISDYVCQMISNILTVTNKLETTTFAKARAKELKSSDEGSTIQKAIQSLASLDKLASIAAYSNEDMEDELNEFLTTKRGGKFYYKNGVNKFFEKYNQKADASQLAITVDNKYDLEKIIKFLNEEINKTILVEVFASYMEDLYDYKKVSNPADGKNGNNISVLYETSARHIVMLFHSFMNILARFSEENRRLCCEKFLANVYGNQHWEGHEVVTQINSLRIAMEDDGPERGEFENFRYDKKQKLYHAHVGNSPTYVVLW